MVTSDPAARPTGASADALPGPQGVDGVDVEEVGDAAAILARGVAISTRLHAAAAGELEAGTATGARAIAEGAEVIQATAQDHAREAAQRALHAVEAVAEALGAAGGAGALEVPPLVARPYSVATAPSARSRDAMLQLPTCWRTRWDMSPAVC